MTHSEFVAAYTSGSLRVDVAKKEAATFLSQRMMLPWILLPLFGIAVACALNAAWLFSGLAFVAALALRMASRATAPGYVLHRSLSDARFYAEVKDLGLLRIEGA